MALESGRDEIVEDKLDHTCLLTKEAINEAWKRFLCGRYGVGDATCPLGKYELMLKLLDMSRYPEHDPANAFVIPQLVFGRNKPKYPATREACVAEGHHHFYFLDGLAAVANDREGLPDEVEANRDHLEHELIDAVKEMLEEEEEEEDDGGAYVPPIAAGRTYEDVDGGAFKKWRRTTRPTPTRRRRSRRACGRSSGSPTRQRRAQALKPRRTTRATATRSAG